jgi:valyl-tRNA synthetase
MALAKKYNFIEAEPRLQAFWQNQGIYEFDRNLRGEVFSIDTPPATVSGNLHLGHVYSYSHTDFVARFWRMRGRNVFYPMGFDDNGLPTDRYVEKRLGIKSKEMERPTFIEQCLQVSEEAEREYRDLWQRLGLSIDWRYTYRTIDEVSREIAQRSFLDLYRKGLAYHRQAPALWCPECQASIAQADLNDLERESEFVTLAFLSKESVTFPIATTRPELLPACVAIFVHPADERYRNLVGSEAITPIFGQSVPILPDPLVDPEKGTGAVMCCTFGDATDVTWWIQHKLPCIQAISPDGRMTEVAGDYAGLNIAEARKQIIDDLEIKSYLLGRKPTLQSVRVHERCDTPVETIMARQWFVSLLDHKAELLEAGEKINWFPQTMRNRYTAWVENLNWDWCLSRQRYFGIPFPVWYCKNCAEVILAGEEHLPVDPLHSLPEEPCPKCGSCEFIPEADVMDTWATSSMSPQIAGKWLEPGRNLYQRVFPFSLRSQAHDIIRTWAFYTITQSIYHFKVLPWKNAAISGWGIAGPGMGKISKSRGGGPMAPMDVIERYSADAVRYWAASTGPGKDAVISEEKIQMGAKLATKLWNVSRLVERFIGNYQIPLTTPSLSPADRWILSRTQKVSRNMTKMLENYDYAAAKSEIEGFFWTELADNYLEMCKRRLYGESGSENDAAVFTVYKVLRSVVSLFAPFLPYITEEIYQSLFRGTARMDIDNPISVHLVSWPDVEEILENEEAELVGKKLVEIATTIRRYKSERNLSLGGELSRVKLAVPEPELAKVLLEASEDLISITRARLIEVVVGNEAIEITL